MRYAILFSLLLAACAGGPAAPDWQTNAKDSLDHAVAAYLSGNERVAALEFAKARSEMARTGQANLVARVELIRCASRVASLAMETCKEFESLKQDAAAPERAYADYLAGQLKAQDIAYLPAAHQNAARAEGNAAAAIKNIDDPLSRLIAAGVLMRTGRAGPEVMALAVDTASEQGWRRPLLAWLGAQALLAEKSGDTQEATRLRRRMNLVQNAKP